eukprot:4251968-Prymnesium_polylepis.2
MAWMGPVKSLASCPQSASSYYQKQSTAVAAAAVAAAAVVICPASSQLSLPGVRRTTTVLVWRLVCTRSLQTGGGCHRRLKQSRQLTMVPKGEAGRELSQTAPRRFHRADS